MNTWKKGNVLVEKTFEGYGLVVLGGTNEETGEKTAKVFGFKNDLNRKDLNDLRDLLNEILNQPGEKRCCCRINEKHDHGDDGNIYIHQEKPSTSERLVKRDLESLTNNEKELAAIKKEVKEKPQEEKLHSERLCNKCTATVVMEGENHLTKVCNRCKEKMSKKK